MHYHQCFAIFWNNTFNRVYRVNVNKQKLIKIHLCVKQEVQKGTSLINAVHNSYLCRLFLSEARLKVAKVSFAKRKTKEVTFRIFRTMPNMNCFFRSLPRCEASGDLGSEIGQFCFRKSMNSKQGLQQCKKDSRWVK